MPRFSHKFLIAIVSLLSLTHVQPALGATRIWSGGTSDLTRGGVGGNWNGLSTPTTTDTAEFQNVGVTDPIVSDLTVTNLFSPEFVQFDAGANAYTLTTDGSNIVPFANFKVGDGGGLGGVINLSSQTQSFEIIRGGIMTFQLGATAVDLTSVSPITYFVGSDNLSFNSSMIFDSALAGTAEITIGSTTYSENAYLTFQGNSSAEQCVINGQNSAIISFIDDSNVDAATITLADSSVVTFDTTTTTSTASVTLTDLSDAVLGQDFTLDRIVTDENTSILLQGNTLIVANPTAGDTIAGAIISPSDGTLIKQGPNDLTLSNEGNSYLGGTIVDEGMLIVNAASLPYAAVQPSATVNGSAILKFNQSSAGTFNGEILLNSATASIQTSGTGPLTLAGAITGAGFLQTNDGYAILASTSNTYTGGTYVLGGTLQVSASTLPTPNNNINTVDGTLVFYETTDQTYDGKILAGSGIVEKRGGAVLTFTGDNSAFSGITKALQGRLALSNLLGGNVIVDTGGSLSGTGTILGNLLVHDGKVEPGSGIGTLTVNGNYQQDTNGIYVAEIDGSGNSDLIDVGGTASLSGSLVVFSVDGVLDPTKTYTILHADGGVSGHFTSVSSNIPTIVPLVTYLPNDVIINLEHILLATATTHNQRAVAKQLLCITNPTAEEAAIINELNMLSSSPYTIDSARRAMDQMSGEQYTNMMVTTELANRQFLRRLYDPLRQILAANACRQNDECTVYQDGSYEFPFQQPPFEIANPYGTFWAEVGGGRSFLRHDSNAHGFNMDTFQFGIGFQQTVLPCLTIGIGGGYQHDKIHYNVGGSGKDNIGLLGLYSLYHPDSFYLLGDLVLGYNSCTVNRPINIGDAHYKAHGKPRAFQGTLYIEGGKSINMEWLQVQPFAGIEADYYYSQNFKENGASPLNLTVHSKSFGAAFSRLGVHLISADVCHYLTFNLDLAWQCRLTSIQNHLKERFTDFCGNFDIYGINSPRNSLEGIANMEVKLGDSCTAFLELSGQRWERLSSYNFLVGFTTTW